MTEFADLGLSKDALAAVERLGFEQPTPVQEQAIPLVLQGKDVIAAASTGTGKTAAFLLPTISQMARVKRGKRAPRMLVLTPTRELAQQIAYTAIKIGRTTGQYITTIYGGTKYNPQISELRNGTDVLIATPGRLVDLMKSGAADLSHIEFLVLDEADRMLDMGFLPDMKTIIGATPTERQTLLFSATIDSSIKNNLGSLLVDPVTIQISRKGETAKNVSHYIIPVKNQDKPELLRSILNEKNFERVIVFARTKARAEDVTSLIRDAGFEAECIHSNRTQTERKRALSAFRSGRSSIIVATDVLARGIDVPAVDYVVNYDLPDMAEDYIHRIGRTGRAGEKGLAVSFVSPTSMKLLDAIEGLLGHSIGIMYLKTYEVDTSIMNSRRGKAKRFASHNRKTSKQPKSNSGVQYNYTGWGDKRKGAKKKSASTSKPASGNRNNRANSRSGKKNKNAFNRKTQKKK